MFQRILVPVDLTPASARAARIAAQLAPRGGVVTLLHVVQVVEGIPFEELDAFYRGLAARARTKMRAIARRAKRKGGPAIDEEVVFGNRVEEILRAARARRTDLIVLASHKVDLESPGQGWGTISYKVGVFARCPVLLVK